MARWPPCADVRLRWPATRTRHLVFIYIYGANTGGKHTKAGSKLNWDTWGISELQNKTIKQLQLWHWTLLQLSNSVWQPDCRWITRHWRRGPESGFRQMDMGGLEAGVGCTADGGSAVVCLTADLGPGSGAGACISFNAEVSTRNPDARAAEASARNPQAWC